VLRNSSAGIIPGVKRSRQWLFNGLAAASIFLICGFVFGLAWTHFHGGQPYAMDSRTHSATYHLSVSSNRAIFVKEWGAVPIDGSGDHGSDILRSGEGYMAIASPVYRHKFCGFLVHGAAIVVMVGDSHGNIVRTLPRVYGNIRAVETPVRWPMGILAAYLVAYAAVAFRKWWIARRRDENQCDHCGYDLRATPHRCPECGTVPGKN
jgi:hypothetical protein